MCAGLRRQCLDLYRTLANHGPVQAEAVAEVDHQRHHLSLFVLPHPEGECRSFVRVRSCGRGRHDAPSVGAACEAINVRALAGEKFGPAPSCGDQQGVTRSGVATRAFLGKRRHPLATVLVGVK